MQPDTHQNSFPLTIAGFFSGTGGVELGLSRTQHFVVQYANEMDSYAATTYKFNFGEEHHVLGDINELAIDSIPDTDVITGGFPCQAFSVAGYRQGFNDEKGRGNLFFRLAEIISHKQPSVVLLENVKGLVGHDNGRTLPIIIETLEELGYTVHWSVLNAKDYSNVPQGRERIYIVGFRDAEAGNKFSFPEPIPLTASLRDFIDYDNKVDDKYYYTAEKYPLLYPQIVDEIAEEEVVYQWRRKYVRANKSGVCPTLTRNMGSGGHNVPLIYTKHGIRKLTPRECFNLQGYPADYKLPNQSDGRLYMQAGNAVMVPVLSRIGEQIWKAVA